MAEAMTKRRPVYYVYDYDSDDEGDWATVDLGPFDGNSLMDFFQDGYTVHGGDDWTPLDVSITVEMSGAAFRIRAPFLMGAWHMTLPWWDREGEA